MIKIYGMPSCQDCAAVEAQIVGRGNEYEYIDIGSHVSLMKEFLRIRDTNPAFDETKEKGFAGIPCFVLDDGTVTLNPEDAGLVEGQSACSIKDILEGNKGC